MRKHKRLIGAIALILGLGLIASACGIGDKHASASSDTHVCVFDGSEKGGQKLKFQLAPGSEARKVDDNDQVVKIPASNRFWNVTNNRSIADPGAPDYYSGNAAGGVPVIVQGQIRFRFNLDLACEWFSKHGRRNAPENGDLGFNVRDDANAPWFRYGNENFVVTMQEVLTEVISKYDWAALHYNYPVNADATGIVPGGAEPAESVRLALGRELGERYTERLRERLGDNYFCGISGGDACPVMEFQVSYAGPGNDSELVKDRQRVENTREEVDTSAQEAQLLEQQRANEQARAEVLELQAQNAERQARIDNAKCLLLAQQGLDCEGHHPPAPVISG